MNNQTQLQYQGNARVVLKIKNKYVELKNRGTSNLMKSFAKFLTGNSDYTLDTPQYLDLQVSDDDGINWKSYLIKSISVSGRNYKQDEITKNWYAAFTAVIGSSSLYEQVDEGDTRKFKLVLQSGTNNEITERQDLAEIAIDVIQVARITPGTQAEILWSMEVSNKGE